MNDHDNEGTMTKRFFFQNEKLARQCGIASGLDMTPYQEGDGWFACLIQ